MDNNEVRFKVHSLNTKNLYTNYYYPFRDVSALFESQGGANAPRSLNETLLSENCTLYDILVIMLCSKEIYTVNTMFTFVRGQQLLSL